MTNKEFDCIRDQVLELLAEMYEASPVKTLSELTSMFVIVVGSSVELSNGDPNLEIFIDGGDSRDITIHPVKPKVTH